MTAPLNSSPDGQQTEAVIAAGMASGDTESVMRAVATAEIVVPQAPSTDADGVPDGSISLPVIEQDGTSYVPVFTSESTMATAAPDIEDAVSVKRRRAGRQLAGRRAVAGREPRHRGRPHPPAGRRALAADVRRRPAGLTARPAARPAAASAG